MLCLASVAFAAAKLDLSDFDTDAMQAVDDAKKELEAGLAAKDTKVSVENAEFIRDSLAWAEGYFGKKGSVADAVKMAGEGREFAAQIARAAAANDFDAASSSYDSLVRTCKSCHDAYKPPKL